MPWATLLLEPRKNRIIGHAGANYMFRGGVRVRVSSDLGLYLRTVKENDKPIFEVVGMDGTNPHMDLEEALGVQLHWQGIEVERV